MTKIEAILRPGKLEDVKDALSRYSIHGMTVFQVMGCGLQKGYKEVYRGTEYSINLLPKIKLEIVVKDMYVEDVVKIISDTARSGEIGDGKIFASTIDNAVRIRTGEAGEEAV